MSTTEKDVDPSVADEVVEGLTAADDNDGPSTAEIDALDDSLVESLEEYASDDDAPSGEADAVVETDADDGANGDEPSDTADAVHTADGDTADGDTADGNDTVAETDTESTMANAATDDDTVDVPKIVMATEDDDTDADTHGDSATDTDTDLSADSGDVEAKAAPTEVPDVSEDILEELRQADIDGPVVDAAPQDDTTSARRRPKKAVDYDPAPIPVPLKVPRILGRKARVRKVTRVVRHVDPWSVFKIAIVAHLVLYLTLLTAGVLLWNVAYATGTVENVERFFESFGWQSFEFNGGEIYHAAWIAGLFGVLGLTGLAVLMATLFNLITDLVGGMRFTVLEEEVVESRSSPMRRFVVRRPEPEIPAVLDDGSGPLIREAVVDDTGGIER